NRPEVVDDVQRLSEVGPRGSRHPPRIRRSSYSLKATGRRRLPQEVRHMNRIAITLILAAGALAIAATPGAEAPQPSTIPGTATFAAGGDFTAVGGVLDGVTGHETGIAFAPHGVANGRAFFAYSAQAVFTTSDGSFVVKYQAKSVPATCDGVTNAPP